MRLKISEKMRGRDSSVLDSGEVEEGLTWQISSTLTGLVDAMTHNKGERMWRENRTSLEIEYPL